MTTVYLLKMSCVGNDCKRLPVGFLSRKKLEKQRKIAAESNTSSFPLLPWQLNPLCPRSQWRVVRPDTFTVTWTNLWMIRCETKAMSQGAIETDPSLIALALARCKCHDLNKLVFQSKKQHNSSLQAIPPNIDTCQVTCTVNDWSKQLGGWIGGQSTEWLNSHYCPSKPMQEPWAEHTDKVTGPFVVAIA